MSSRQRRLTLPLLTPLLLVPPLLLLGSLPDFDQWSLEPDDEASEGPIFLGDGRFHLGMRSVHFPWKGEVRASGFDVPRGGEFAVDFDFVADLTKARGFYDEIESMYAVLVGEPVAHADGRPTGFNGIALATRFTAAGVPLEHYHGTLPVSAFGDGRGSPFEAVAEFPRDALDVAADPEHVRLRGRWTVPVHERIPEGWYRPHVELFVRLRGSEKKIDLRHLGIHLGPWVNDRADTMRPRIPVPLQLNAADLHEFMKDAQVLPNVKVGKPAPPRLVFTLFHDVAAQGQSGLLSKEDAAVAGLSNRSRFPTPFVLQPGRWATTPGLPANFPSTGMAGLFQGFDSLAREIESWLVLDSGSFTMKVTDPLGNTRDLGARRIARTDRGGLELSPSKYEVDLQQTGQWSFELHGCFDDVLGRRLCGGGTYELSCALPMTFSTAVKPGTNFLVGQVFPAVMDINPAVEADVEVAIHYVPQSDESRAQDWTVGGRSTHWGYFEPEQFPPPFPEPGEYLSLTTVRWRDGGGNLWLGQQSSAGVIAPVLPEMRLHGTRTSFFDPRAEMPKIGAFERYNVPFEGGSSFAEHSGLSFYDHTFAYHSGDVLYVPTTYPLESVIGPSLSMSAETPELKARLESLFLKNGPLAPYPIANRFRRLWFLPHVYKQSEDNFAYHTIEPGVMDNLPVVPVSRSGYSPYAWPDGIELDAYSYLSVIRPGLPVLSIAFSGNYMAPCWIISPNDYGYRFHSSPNGDLPEDLYRVMGGLVVRDLSTGRNYYDAYSSAIRILPPGAGYTAVQAPGELPMTTLGGRDEAIFLGLNTSGVFATGHRLLLGGTLMPPTQAEVSFDVTWPSGRTFSATLRANRVGGVKSPPDLYLDEPGIYRVKTDIALTKQDGSVVHGDVVGSGDGEILYFALPKDAPRVFASSLPAMSRVPDRSLVKVPLRWVEGVQDARLTWSVMTPGSLFDEGSIDLSGSTHDFVWRPRQAQIQLPNYDTVDYGSGQALLTDIVVFVFFLEGTLDGERVYDAIRVAMRGDVLLNPDALLDKERLGPVAGFVGGGASPGASWPGPAYVKQRNLDGLDLEYGQVQGIERAVELSDRVH
jgi:hypothetical protein